MAHLHYCFIVVFVIFSVKLVISDECNEKRTTITNEEHIDENSNYYGGDIILTEQQKELLLGRKDVMEGYSGTETEAAADEKAHSVNRRAVTRISVNLWPSGVVPYVLDSSLNSAAVNAIRSAIKDYETNTCIRFVQRTSQSDYIQFLKDRGCYSYVGRTGAAGQVISIGSGCEYKGIVIHEIFHALGRWHEQSRPDRDNYIKVNYQNIRSGTSGNFDKVSLSAATTQGITYDLRSIMHYDAYAFSSNGRPTIEPQNTRVKLSSIGQRDGFTDLDLQHVNILYGCSSLPPGGLGSWGSWNRWSSCSVSCGGGTQTRTRMCSGSGCTGQSRQIRRCNTNSCPVRRTLGPWGSWSSCSLTCGRGRRTRTRTCQGTGCTGTLTQTQLCNTQACPTTSSGVWGTWTSWTPCASTCGGGLRFRWRRCLSGHCRSGKSFELLSCGSWQCSPAFDLPLNHRSKSTEVSKDNMQYLTAESDAEHISCQVLNFQNNHLFIRKQNLVPTIISGPFQMHKAKDKCIKVAKSMSYTHIGVMGGYCIHTKFQVDPDQHNRQSHVKCKDGVGNYDPSSTTQYMDVYRLTSTTRTSEQASNLTIVKAVESVSGAVYSGAPPHMGYSMTYFVIILFLSILIWL